MDLSWDGLADAHGIIAEGEHHGGALHGADALELRAGAGEAEDALGDVLDDGEERLAGGAGALRNDTEVLSAGDELGDRGKERFLRVSGDDLGRDELVEVAWACVVGDLELDGESNALIDALLHARGVLEEERATSDLLDDDVVSGLALNLGIAQLDLAPVRLTGLERLGDYTSSIGDVDDVSGHLLAGIVGVRDDAKLDLHADLDAVLVESRDLPEELALRCIFANEGEKALLAFGGLVLDLAGVLLAFFEFDDDVFRSLLFFASTCGGG